MKLIKHLKPVAYNFLNNTTHKIHILPQDNQWLAVLFSIFAEYINIYHGVVKEISTQDNIYILLRINLAVFPANKLYFLLSTYRS